MSRRPTEKHLNKFVQKHVFSERSKSGKQEAVNIGQGKKFSVRKLQIKEKALTTPDKFEYVVQKGSKYRPEIKRVYRPRDMYFGQNDNLPKAKGKFAKDKVKSRVKAATAMPKFEFNYNHPIKLSKPSYGKPPRTIL